MVVALEIGNGLWENRTCCEGMFFGGNRDGIWKSREQDLGDRWV